VKLTPLVLLLFVWSSALADDDFRGRFLKEVGSSTHIDLVAFSQRGSSLSTFGRPKLEYLLGLLHSDKEQRGVISVGPVWQHFSYTGHGVFIKELAFAPTILTAGKFHGRDMGGILHFTTGLALGWN